MPEGYHRMSLTMACASSGQRHTHTRRQCFTHVGEVPRPQRGHWCGSSCSEPSATVMAKKLGRCTCRSRASDACRGSLREARWSPVGSGINAGSCGPEHRSWAIRGCSPLHQPCCVLRSRSPRCTRLGAAGSAELLCGYRSCNKFEFMAYRVVQIFALRACTDGGCPCLNRSPCAKQVG